MPLQSLFSAMFHVPGCRPKEKPVIASRSTRGETVSYHDRVVVLLLVGACLLPAGCTRRHYRLRADRDSYGLLTEKTLGTPWQVPNDYSVYPAPGSRLADPWDPDWPWLPPPGPTLYGEPPADVLDEEASEEVAAPDPLDAPLDAAPSDTPMQRDDPRGPAPSEGRFDEAPLPSDLGVNSSLRRFPPTRPANEGAESDAAAIQLVHYQQDASGDGAAREPLPPPVPQPLELQSPAGPVLVDPAAIDLAAPRDSSEIPGGEVLVDGEQTPPIQPIPPEYWNVLPPSTLLHMLEFESVREEFIKTFGADSPLLDATADSRANLNELVDIARRNSREYQTQKEQLYVSALNLSLERFDYQLRFTPRGNGTDVDYVSSRVNGNTINTLGIGTTFGVERMLATGGNFLARFANDVLLTFNGPQGFTADVSSELFFELTQAVLQRDILLEPLIQSERTLVYSARDFARFRKEFFFDIASRYYGLLRTYRSIEIETQNYLSLVRTLEQARAEVRAEVRNAPNQVRVDQFEQGMLSGRSSLIATSNALDQSLDQFKLALGLPTDMPLEIDLDELEELTLLDQTEVAIERVRRFRTTVAQRRVQEPLPEADLLNEEIFLIERLIDWLDLREQLGRSVEGRQELEEMYLWLRQEQARSEATLAEIEFRDIEQPPILVYLRGTGWLENLIRLVDRQIQRLETLPSDDQPPGVILEARREWAELQSRLRESRETLALNPTVEQLDELVRSVRQMLADADDLVKLLDEQLGNNPDLPRAVQQRRLLEITDALLEVTNTLVGASDTGLPEVEINVDDAMVTALVQRLDLMNERGFLADDWRRVKLAADDLKSILNLNASHSLRTDRNSPFDFDFDDSRTTLGVTLDLPFNRRAQRNNYRASLINYQSGRRSVMRLEDSIKFDIRNGLRNLELARVQYPISVTRAALAAEQVISIQLQLTLGTPDVRGRDLLDALQASREALTSVANSRIGFLVDRARFVLDLELMQVDEDGFWPQINDPTYQPQPNFLYPPNAGPTYGTLSPCVKPSKLMYHIYGHRLPGQTIEHVEVPEEMVQGP